MSSPQRIQLRRTKGWRMPENTVRCCRPGPWGNPFKLIEGRTGLGDKCWTVEGPPGSLFVGYPHRTQLLARQNAVGCYSANVACARGFRARICRELAGKNLACWCPLPAEGQPDHCHAAFLLEIANAGGAA